MSARVLFVNRFYWPDEPATAQLLTDLATRLAAAGFEVTVIASRPSSSAPKEEIDRGVRICRIDSPRFKPFGLMGKLGAFAAFFLAASWRLLRTLRKGDTLVCLTDPPLLAVPAAFACGLRGARCVHWIQDTYPEVAVAVTGKRAPLLLRPLRNWVWRKADFCVTLGADMAALVKAAGVPDDRLRIIPNWAPAGLSEVTDAEVQAQKRAWGLEERFVLMYSGNLGRVHALEPLLDVARALKGDDRVVIVMLGGGAQKDFLAKAAKAQGLSNLHFLPSQPREHLSLSLGAGDAHFVTLKPGCEACVFPSKLYGIAAIARPVLYIGPKPAEIADIIETAHMGKTFTAKDIDEIAGFVRALASSEGLRTAYKDGARAFARENAGATRAWIQVLGAPMLAAGEPNPNTGARR